MKNLKSFYLAVVCAASLATTAVAQDGSLDASFGTGGIVSTNTEFDYYSLATAIQSDGKIVVAGASFETEDILVSRYNSNGTLDNTFGSSGIVVTDFSAPSEARSVAIQPDGKIVVAGSVVASDFTSNFALVRYNTNGTLDNTFGSGTGKVVTDLGATEVAVAIAYLPSSPSGATLLVLGSTTSSTGARDFALVRYFSNGNADNTFGSDSRVITDFGGTSDLATSLIVQADGKAIVAGSASASDIALARYTTSGSLDNTFGTGGKVITDLGGSDFARSLALQPDGKLIVGGSTTSTDFAGSEDFTVLRYSTAGMLDNTFGTGGKVITDFAGFTDEVYAVGVQFDGKIVAVGTTSPSSSDANVGVARYSSAGVLDNTFGSGGKVSTAVIGAGFAFATRLQFDGKIVAAGYTVPTNEVTNVLLIRYNNRGAIDGSFGTGGKSITTPGGTPYATALQADGKVLISGTISNGSSLNFTTVRLLSTGAIDSTFGSGGKVETDFGGNDAAYAVAVQADGKIVVAGQSGATLAFTVVRYNADGSLDNTFATAGKFILDLQGSDVANSLAIQSDGKILAAGSTFDGISPNFTVVRLNTNGTLDNAFGTGGIANVDFGGSEFANKVVALPRGKVLLVGTIFGTNQNFALARLNSNGSIDSTFGTGGKVTTDFSGGGDNAFDAVVSIIGKITVAGSSSFTSTGGFALARYNTNGTLDNTFGTGGKVTTRVAGSSDVARSLAVQKDGKLVAIGYATGNGFFDFALARYSNAGVLDATFGNAGTIITDLSGGSDIGYAGFLQPDGKIVEIGSTQVNFTNNFAAVRYNTGTTGAAPQASAELTESSVETQSSLEIGTPQSFELGSNYPNPFNPSTVIGYQLPVSGEVRLNVYDMLGREVATLVNEKQAAGTHSVTFNAAGLPSGMYLYKLQAGSFSATKKMLLVK